MPLKTTKRFVGKMTQIPLDFKSIVYYICVILLIVASIFAARDWFNPKDPANVNSDQQTVLPLDHPMRQSYAFDVSTPEAQGMDSKTLALFFEKIKEEQYDIHHIQILKNGKLVAASQRYPYQANELHTVSGITHSITSTAIGRLIDTQELVSLDVKVNASFYPNASKYTSPHKETMSWRHVLTMTDGFSWIESGRENDANSSDNIMHVSEDALKYVMDQSVIRKPGLQFSYNSGTSMLLSGLVERISNKSLSDFVQDTIFKPLSIARYFWSSDVKGQTIGGNGLYLTPQDLLKIGYSYAHDGKWQGKTIVSREWILQATSEQVETPQAKLGKNGYGLSWWQNSFGGYSARGYKGQYLFVVPEEDLVVVFLSGLSLDQQLVPEQLMQDYVLPSIKGKGDGIIVDTLLDNPRAYKRLEAAMQALNTPPDALPVPAIKPLGLKHSGTLYRNENPSIRSNLLYDSSLSTSIRDQATQSNTQEPDFFGASSVDLQGASTPIIEEQGELIGLEFVDGKDYATFQWLIDGESFKAYVGLDNQYRITRLPNYLEKGLVSPVAMRGKWLSDVDFEIEIVPIQSTQKHTMRLTYSDDGLVGHYE